MTAQRRTELVAAYEGSGLTMAAFARREGINYTTLAHWVMKTRRASAPTPAIRFAEVALPAAEVATKDLLEVRLSDGTVVRGGGVAEVAALVLALRS